MHGNEFNFFGGSDCDLSGIKLAQVVSNIDPTAQERVMVRVLGVHNMSNTTDPDYSIMAHHCAPSNNSSGDIPNVGDWLYVMFTDVNNPNQCIYLGYARYSVQ